MNTADVFFFLLAQPVTLIITAVCPGGVCPPACCSSGVSVGVSVLSMSQIKVGFNLEHYNVIQMLNTDYSQHA